MLPLSRTARRLAAISLLLLLPATVHAHTATGIVGGFASGFLHPLTGLDHIAAMVAVGIWGAYLRAPAMWLLPVIFPVVMAFGGALGVLGVPIPGVEMCIALSAVALGLMVALAARPPLWIAAVLVGFFAIFHGHAHGTELPQSANAMTYAVGFVVATGLLHLSGIALGLLVH
jgi:urease accessory protein